MASDFLKKPIQITVGTPSCSETIKQELVYVQEHEKMNLLLELLKSQTEKTIVFCETKAKTNEICQQIRRERIECEVMHGDLEQNERNSAIKAFKEKAKILVATDCAQRGLDIPHVQLVVNYDCPKQAEDYIHRIGRTGRVGQEGRAVTFVNRENSYVVQ